MCTVRCCAIFWGLTIVLGGSLTAYLSTQVELGFVIRAQTAIPTALWEEAFDKVCDPELSSRYHPLSTSVRVIDSDYGAVVSQVTYEFRERVSVEVYNYTLMPPREVSLLIERTCKKQSGMYPIIISRTDSLEGCSYMRHVFEFVPAGKETTVINSRADWTCEAWMRPVMVYKGTAAHKALLRNLRADVVETIAHKAMPPASPHGDNAGTTGTDRGRKEEL